MHRYARFDQLYDLDQEFKEFKKTQVDNAKITQVEKDIKDAKDGIFVSLKRYLKRETFHEKVQAIEDDFEKSKQELVDRTEELK